MISWVCSTFPVDKNGHSLFLFAFYSTASIFVFTKPINQVPIIKSQFVCCLIFGMLSILISMHQISFNLFWKIWRTLGGYFNARNNFFPLASPFHIYLLSSLHNLLSVNVDQKNRECWPQIWHWKDGPMRRENSSFRFLLKIHSLSPFPSIIFPELSLCWQSSTSFPLSFYHPVVLIQSSPLLLPYYSDYIVCLS